MKKKKKKEKGVACLLIGALTLHYVVGHHLTFVAFCFQGKSFDLVPHICDWWLLKEA